MGGRFRDSFPIDEIKAALEKFKPVKGRMNVIETARRIHLVDDTYNANPVSMAAAIQTLQKIKDGHRGILVIGDMLELGKEAPELHRKVGEIAAGRNLPVDILSRQPDLDVVGF